MPEGDVETYHADGSWKNRIEGHGDLSATYDTREDAVWAGQPSTPVAPCASPTGLLWDDPRCRR
ncbi:MULTISPECIES: DUF2188 domain-containing protein [unclassified Nocardioides]|uniref:DUF2188 domain-containing protein n=1 Tax=Nocardioides sp. (strain ATCC BAA-499 / JS614) TaxID=196162 RepID=UPI000A016068